MAIDIVPSAPINSNVRDNEQKKFAENANGNVVVRTEDESVSALFTGSLLQGIKFDNGSVSYPDNVTEVFTYRLAAVVVATVTLVYTSAGKSRLSTFAVVTP